MAREKANYRDMLSFLVNDLELPLLMSKVQAASALGISRIKLDEIIAKGSIPLTNRKIAVGSIARYLCD